MAKLAAHSILAIAITDHVWLAEGHSELGGDVSLLHKFIISVGESALNTEYAVLTLQPELANFSLLLLFVVRLKVCHVVCWVVGLVSWRARHPENWTVLESLSSWLELGAACLHAGNRGEETFSFRLGKKSFHIFVRLCVLDDVWIFSNICHLEWDGTSWHLRCCVVELQNTVWAAVVGLAVGWADLV